MTETNTQYFNHDVDSSSVSSQPYMMVWLYWLRAWLGLSYDDVLRNDEQCFEIQRPKIIPRDTRACRRFIAHHMKRECPHVHEHSTMAILLPNDLSETQYRERLARVSAHGRVHVLGISNIACVLLRRARLVCYDHGWWRTPLLTLSELVCPLRPP